MRRAALVLVDAGRKTVASAREETTARAGDALALVPGHVWDVVNDPDGRSAYRARLLVFDRDDLLALEALHGTSACIPPRPVTAFTPDAGLRETARRTIAALAEEDAALARHRVLETLLLLRRRGIEWTVRDPEPIDETVRRLVGSGPARRWTAGEIGSLLHVGESTLRRRLGARGMSLRRILVETRLEAALELLQTTSLPVGEIAARVGLPSHGRFARAFRERFGFAPSALRPKGDFRSETHEHRARSHDR